MAIRPQCSQSSYELRGCFWATLPDELVGSAREAAEERSQLGGDTKNGAFDDADDGGDEPAEEGNSRHESTSLSVWSHRVVGKFCWWPLQQPTAASPS
jgi:hypothetical protein